MCTTMHWIVFLVVLTVAFARDMASLSSSTSSMVLLPSSHRSEGATAATVISNWSSVNLGGSGVSSSDAIRVARTTEVTEPFVTALAKARARATREVPRSAVDVQFEPLNESVAGRMLNGGRRLPQRDCRKMEQRRLKKQQQQGGVREGEQAVKPARRPMLRATARAAS